MPSAGWAEPRGVSPGPAMISFGDFQLDPQTRRLRHRGSERSLRAKSSAVLLYLAEHPSRLVTHAELLRAVWPGTAVSPTVLRVCIREIRAAIGEDADRFLATLPRRGFRFTLDPGDRGLTTPIFVGREAEKSSLHDALARARGGTRQVVLVSGEAGAGKTALLQQFLEELRVDGIRCAHGQAVELNSPTAGCAAVLDLLSRLCDEADGDEVVRALGRWAPGWLLQLPGRIDATTAEGLRGRSPEASWEGQLLELSEAIERLAEGNPLVLALEDLQWSDASTIDALAFLSKRTVAARLLLVGSFRPESLTESHPLAAPIQRLGASGLGSQVELGPFSCAETSAYLDRRLAPHRLADGVARDIHRASGGNARTVVTLVSRLLDRRRLTVREGAWQLDGGVEDVRLEIVEQTLAPPRIDPPASDPGLVAERRQLTVLSCELVGATDLAQRLDPEDLRSVVRAYQEAASAVVDRHGGHVAQFLVDGLLAYFSYPRAHEDDAVRAANAGLEILDALERLGDAVEREHGARLATRIGVHTGPVVIDAMGAGPAREMLALGEVPHLAVRVREAAEPGSLLLTDATRRLLAGNFVLEALGEQIIEARRPPLALHRVIRRTGVRGRLAASVGPLTPFIGREVELAALTRAWAAAREGKGGSVLVRGEAGVGKSRLAARLREEAAGVPHAWLESGANPTSAGTPFYPAATLLGQQLALTDQDSQEESLAKIAGGLGALATSEAVALVAELVGVPPPTRIEISPELQRRRTIELVAQWLLAISARRPTVLLVEDLHWCDPSSLELLRYLIEQAPPAPLFVLLTARPEFIPPWTTNQHATVLDLARLSDQQARAMVSTLAAEGLPHATLEALVARSDGVPLYVEELTKSVLEPGGGHDPAEIPATLADSLMGRLDRLAGAKEVAQRAAALGREFTGPLLAAVTDLDEVRLRRELARLVDAGIVLVRGEPGEEIYTFKHALLQETAHQSLLRRTQRQLHERIARVLEESFPESAAADPEWIARHYDQAGLVVPAIAHYRRAGERAAQRFANEEAIAHLKRALDLVATLPETRERNQSELELRMALGVPLSASRGWSNPEYESLFVRARELASRVGEPPELPRVLDGMSAAYLMRGDLRTAVEVAQETMAAAVRTGEPFDLLVAHLCVGTPQLFQGSFAVALDHFEHTIALYDPERHAAFANLLGFDRGVAARSYGAVCQGYLGNLDRAIELSREAVALAKRLEHPFSVANALSQLSVVEYTRGEFDRVRASSQELVELAERLGFPFWLGVGRFFHGRARVEFGEGAAGVAEMQDALTGLAAMGSGLSVPATLAVHAEALRCVGRHDEALGTVDLGLLQAAMNDQHYTDAELYRTKAEILLDQHGQRESGWPGDPADSPEALLARSLEIARSQGARVFELSAALRLAGLWRRQGRPEEARALLGPICAWFSEGLDAPRLVAAKALLAELG